MSASIQKRIWSSSLSEHEHEIAVTQIRQSIAEGDVYEVNLCRVLSTPVEKSFELLPLANVIAGEHPSNYFMLLQIPSHNIYVLSASPERFLQRQQQRISTRPIKGTVATGGEFLEKDRAENIMIVDLMRNDLNQVCLPGSVVADELLVRESHPTLDHLVSKVEGELRTDTNWSEILTATFPPGSVTGAPKIAACEQIAKYEPVSRGPYCGAIGWIDGTHQTADLGVAIRTFWIENGSLCFGTGGAITYDSNAKGEWEETELKARRLISFI